jgi:hypothetical protein
MIRYDEEEESLMENPELPPTYSNHPEVVELFLFVHPIRQAATPVEALLVKVMEMQQRRRGWRLYLPSYPFTKALQRTNAQVRHDRGGVTAGYYFHSQSQLARTSMLRSIYSFISLHLKCLTICGTLKGSFFLHVQRAVVHQFLTEYSTNLKTFQ